MNYYFLTKFLLIFVLEYCFDYYKRNAHGECVWNSNKAIESGEISLLENIVPHDRKEAALKLFHENDYRISGSVLDKIMHHPPNHGMNWSSETKQAFSQAMIQENKKFTAVSKIIHESVGNCQNFYYGCFKRTPDYSKMKRSIKKKKKKLNISNLESSSSISSGGECVICNEFGELIYCDICEQMYHLHCASPQLLEIPEGDWFCQDCETMKKS